MRSRLIKMGAALAGVAALAVGGSALATAAQKSPKTTPPPAAPAAASPAASSTEATDPAGDTDNVQQGDQTSADTATAGDQADPAGSAADQSTAGDQADPAGSAAEQSASETGPSDGPGGYADTSPNADTQQTGEH